MNSNALIIFVKTPVAGFVKTRLNPEISGSEAVSLYTAFLRDLQKRFENKDEFTCWYAVDPEAYDPQKIKTILNSDRIFLQTGIDLGQRMYNALALIFSKGYKNNILIGSDIPHLPVTTVLKGFRLLKQKECQIVIGPAKDGGYYLIGMHELLNDLFTDIHWSTKNVFDQTLERAKRKNYFTKTLKSLSDIDDYMSLKRLYGYLKKMNPNTEDFPERTWAILDKVIRSKKLKRN
jgi:rSAM/selenodomain-associated transferase 1